VEVPRAVAERGSDAARQARRVLDGLHLLPLGDALLDAAGELRVACRSLDAIHVTAAQHLGEDLEYLVTYDRRMAAAAVAHGMPVAAPS
jgi:predicted nucleic acid-binding protein